MKDLAKAQCAPGTVRVNKSGCLGQCGHGPVVCVYIARERHVQALQKVSTHLSLADSQLTSPNAALDLLAEELRLAQNDLSAITGEFTSDDLLGVIFSKFCIGK